MVNDFDSHSHLSINRKRIVKYFYYPYLLENRLRNENNGRNFIY